MLLTAQACHRLMPFPGLNCECPGNRNRLVGFVMPGWLHAVAIAALWLGALCAAIVTIDLTRHPQHMWIMNLVWPLTALFGTVWVTWQ